MKTSYKIITIVALLGGLTVAAQAQAPFVIGSWQNPASGDGWVVYNTPPPSYNDANNGGPILTTYPSEYSIVSAGVPGYTYSLALTYTGFGGGLEYYLYGASLAAFNAGAPLQLTFGVPADPSGGSGGYNQIYDVAIAAPGIGTYGYLDIPFSDFTEVSILNDNTANSSGQPNYYFWSTAAERAQVVTINIPANILTAVLGSGEAYVGVEIRFNNGSDANDQTCYLNQVEFIPEPSTLALIGLGAVGLLMVCKRQKS